MDITPGKEMGTLNQKHLTHGEGFMHVFESLRTQFPTFKHNHPPVMNVNELHDEQMSTGDRVADRVASTVGSWPFIIIQSIILAAWITLNVIAWAAHWDPYPFILLNLALSFQAAYSAPFVMMSQNRQAAKDRLMAESDYKTNVKGETEICNVMEHLDHQDQLIFQILERIESQHHEILNRLSKLSPEEAKEFIGEIEQMNENF